jgi:hypothetical protein
MRRSLPKKWSPCPCVMKIVVSVLPVLAIISPSASTSSLISSASTRTASPAPKINVDVVGENVRLASPAITRVGLVNARRSSELAAHLLGHCVVARSGQGRQHVPPAIPKFGPTVRQHD